MRNLKTFENFSSHDMNSQSRQEMTEYLMSCGYSEEECTSMDYEEMCQVCDGCGMNDMNEARKYTRKKTAQAQKKEAQKAQKEADKKIAQAQKTLAQAQKSLTQAQKERSQAQKAQGQKFAQTQKTGQPAKGAQPDVKTFSQVQKSAQKGAKKMTQKEKELAAKYPPFDQITRGDIIAAAIKNKNKSSKKTTK